MSELTAGDICRAINALRKNKNYGYINPATHGEIKLIRVELPEGPIVYKRRRIKDSWGNEESIGSPSIWRYANALNTELPVNIDRVFAGSYNFRSVLESLVAHTPEFYTCHPGRQEIIDSNVKIKKGHKHIIWCPEEQHALGKIVEKPLGEDCIISEIPSYSNMYDVVPAPAARSELPIEIRRRHSQIQVALTEIANALNMRSWLAVEDHGIKYKQKVITQYPFIVKNLSKEPSIIGYSGAIKVAKHIDCMFFNGGLPFAFEVEHTTGVTSGLDRLLRFRNIAEHLNTRYVIVAPDEDRNDVLTKINLQSYEDLNAMYFPYSQVEELFSFLRRHSGRLTGVKKDFLLTFMERAS